MATYRNLEKPWAGEKASKPHPPTPQSSRASSKGKGKNPQTPKSKDVRRLEKLLAGFNGTLPASGAHPAAEPCYCLARTHPLSTYTPICTRCGLILCVLHTPYLPCPHCSSPLLTPPAHAALAIQIEEELERTLAKEEATRRRLAEEARAAEGAFPTLGPVSVAGGPRPVPTGPHKVLSLDPKKKTATLSTYHDAPSPKSLSRAPSEEPEERVTRVPPPPVDEVPHFKGGRAGQLWRDLGGENAVYVEVPKPPNSEKANAGKGKGKAKETQGQTAGGSGSNS
ncbi:hypothetical protein OF83DRAFT_1166257 [Amylostereum chailletii]|nr:hypothetical protein OF83DRAFT_1166257 [Amylostereum chailletii]